MDAIFLNEIKSFIDGEGRLTAIPAKRKRQLYALLYIAEKLPKGMVWNEKELNARLGLYHTFGDPAWIRRELVELGYLSRDAYCTRYEVTGDIAALEALIAGI